jgi:hypothetical protein
MKKNPTKQPQEAPTPSNTPEPPLPPKQTTKGAKKVTQEPKQVKGKAGRPKWKPSKENLEQVEGWAAAGATGKQIAEALGISFETLRVSKKRYPAFLAAVKRGEAKGLLEAVKNLRDLRLSGNLGATIFYLKNKGGGEWKDVWDLKAKVENNPDKKLEDMTDAELTAFIKAERAKRSGKGGSAPNPTPEGPKKPS